MISNGAQELWNNDTVFYGIIDEFFGLWSRQKWSF